MRSILIAIGLLFAASAANAQKLDALVVDSHLLDLRGLRLMVYDLAGYDSLAEQSLDFMYLQPTVSFSPEMTPYLVEDEYEQREVMLLLKKGEILPKPGTPLKGGRKMGSARQIDIVTIVTREWRETDLNREVVPAGDLTTRITLTREWLETNSGAVCNAIKIDGEWVVLWYETTHRVENGKEIYQWIWDGGRIWVLSDINIPPQPLKLD